MLIFLDSSEQSKIIFFVVYPNQEIESFIFQGKKADQGPLFCFDELIKKKKIILKKISGIGIKIGAGRFTATRIAVTFGNALSYFLQKPIIGMEEFEVNDFLKKIKKVKKGLYLSAKYSGEANIGKSKQ